MADRLPDIDAVPLSAPARREPLPPEVPVERLDAGVVLCELTTPYMMGSTNCWLLIGEDDVLCVDPGSDAALAIEQLGAALAPYGRTLDSIGTILVTHTHPDHCGAAAGLAEAADAVVAIGAGEADWLAGQPDPPQAVGEAWRAFGAPREEVQRATQTRPVHAPVPAARLRPLHDATHLQAGGRRWRVHVVGGHSPAHVVLVGEDTIVAGDQLLANVFAAVHPGPLRPTSGAAARHQAGLRWAPSVAEFLASMDRFETGFASMTILPGHGAAFRGPARPIQRVRRYHQVRCNLVAAKLAARPTTVWDLALDMYAGLVSADGIDRRFASAAAEIAGRLEALVQAGRATFTLRDDVVVFAAA